MTAAEGPAPTERFSDRVEAYERHRPSYPAEVFEVIEGAVGPGPGGRAADLGAGTGIASRSLLERGWEVHAVEPNDAMRRAAEAALGGHPRFRAVAAPAEATGLPAAAFDLALAAQAFHWFDPGAVRRELLRILKPGGEGRTRGVVALLWNRRLLDATPFLVAYEALLQRFGTDYRQVDSNHRQVVPEVLPGFFGGPFETRTFDNAQTFDAEGLRGRLLSSSYLPGPGHPEHPALLAAQGELFAQHQAGGEVEIVYETELFFGPLSA